MFWVLQMWSLPAAATAAGSIRDSCYRRHCPHRICPDRVRSHRDGGSHSSAFPCGYGQQRRRRRSPGPGRTDQLDFDAEALLLLELNSETMVYAKNIDTRREPASLTKVMTCLLALEHGTLTDTVTVSEEALHDLDPSGSSSGLMAGETFTLEQLLYCLMIESGNDAAAVIARTHRRLGSCFR